MFSSLLKCLDEFRIFPITLPTLSLRYNTFRGTYPLLAKSTKLNCFQYDQNIQFITKKVRLISISPIGLPQLV